MSKVFAARRTRKWLRRLLAKFEGEAPFSSFPVREAAFAGPSPEEGKEAEVKNRGSKRKATQKILPPSTSTPKKAKVSRAPRVRKLLEKLFDKEVLRLG
jgi:hypothetical protein